MNKNDFCSVCKKKMLSMLSIAYFSLLTTFCKIVYMFFPSQVLIFFLSRIENVCSVLRRMQEVRQPEHSLFGYYNQRGNRTHLTKGRAKRQLGEIWAKPHFTGIFGHSFRVGGASLRFALEVPVTVIKKLGWWESDCYKVHIRDYSKKETIETMALLKHLQNFWDSVQ
jgi:hypothetical protein